MEDKVLDQLDELLITLIVENGPQSAMQIHDKIEKEYPDQTRTLIWSRLLNLVEFKYLEIEDTESSITLFKIKE